MIPAILHAAMPISLMWRLRGKRLRVRTFLIPVVVAKACPDVHASMHPSLLCDWTYAVSCAEIERIFLNNKKMKKFKKGVAF